MIVDVEETIRVNLEARGLAITKITPLNTECFEVEGFGPLGSFRRVVRFLLVEVM